MSDGFDTATLDSNEPHGNRKYDSSHRRALADRTHQAVLDAGRRLFLTRGYGRTTMRDIAGEAGVAVDSVYGHVRTKSALLTELMDRAHGDHPGAAVADRDWVRAIRAADGAEDRLDTLARNLTAVYGELAPLHLAVRRAADADATAARIWDRRSAERLEGMQGLADRLLATGAVPPALDASGVRDILYALTSPELYGLFVLDRGWPPERYTDWLAATLRAQLVAGGPSGPTG